MERVSIQSARVRALTSADAFDVLSDRGAGAIDTAHPLTRRPVRYWDGLPVAAGHLLAAHLAHAHLDNIIPDGHLHGAHLESEHLWPAAIIEWITAPLPGGVMQFALRLSDDSGNAAAPTAAAPRIVNTAPRSPEALTRTSFDPLTRRLTLSFAAA